MSAGRSAAEMTRAGSFAGRRVTVMGLGLQGGGVEVVRFLAAQGARVTVTDTRPEEALRESLAAIAGCNARTVLGEHRESDFTGCDTVVANPAVAPSHPMLAAARAQGVLVTSEMALFLERCRARLVLITGTQGKSSTSNATAQLLAACGVRVHLGGNIGRALIGEADSMEPGDVAVVEVSSYQLEALPGGFGPIERVAAIGVTNVLADHLERHGTVEAYEAAKRRILDLAPGGATLVLSGEDERVRRWEPARGRVVRAAAAGSTHDGLHVEDGEFRLGSTRLGRVADCSLPGDFQRENVLIALGLAHALGAPAAELVAAVRGLRGLPHRLEDLGCFAGHRVWDNGVSTTPDSTVSALRALEGEVALLCGGQAKALALDELVATARERRLRVITFGGSGAALADAFRAGGVGAEFERELADATRLAFERMAPGEELLFSPACASFDRYRNFRDRALAFRAALPGA